MNAPILSEVVSNGHQPEILFWVGCAGSFDQRAQSITKAFAMILDKIGIDYAILEKKKCALETQQEELEMNSCFR